MNASTVLGISEQQRHADKSESASTRWLLLAGVVAGPFYLTVGLIQALSRPGFDLRRHELSQLALGDWGWIQVANFWISGLLVVVSAVGMRQALVAGRGRTWGPVLIALYGIGLLGAGIFTADPALGFPPGTPADVVTISTHGLLHLACAAVGFLGLIAACFVFGRREISLGRRRVAAYSIATGGIFFTTFFGGVMLAGSQGLATLLLWIGVVLAWAWLTITSCRLLLQGGIK